MGKKMKRVSIIFLGVLLVFSFGLLGCFQEAAPDEVEDTPDAPVEPIVLRLAENQPAHNPVTIAMEKFADLVGEKTNGEVEIKVYAAAVLGDEFHNIEAVRADILDMARVSAMSLVPTAEKVTVFSLPYIFAGREHAFRVLDGEIGDEVLKNLEDYNMVGFGWICAGARSFYTTERPIRSLADLQGLKIRVMGADTVIRMTELLGAVPTPMGFGEVFTALQTGVVDGAENDFVSYYTAGHYEVAKYYTLSEHLRVPALIIMSKAVWDDLSPEHQRALEEAAHEAIEWQRVAMHEMQAEFREKVEAAGTTVFEVDLEEFQEAAMPLHDEFPQFKEIIERIRALQ